MIASTCGLMLGEIVLFLSQHILKKLLAVTELLQQTQTHYAVTNSSR